jgi:hypothetical protein
MYDIRRNSLRYCRKSIYMCDEEAYRIVTDYLYCISTVIEKRINLLSNRQPLYFLAVINRQLIEWNSKIDKC